MWPYSYIPSGFIVKLNDESLEISDPHTIRIDSEHFYIEDEAHSNLFPSGSIETIRKYSDVLTVKKLSHLDDFKFNFLDSYLGDFKLNQEINIPIGIDQPQYSYKIISASTDNLKLQGIYLQGMIKTEINTIQSITIECQDQSDQRKVRKEYFFRSYTERSYRPSYVKNDFIDLGYGDARLEYSPEEPFYRGVPIEDFHKFNLEKSPIEYATDWAHELIDRAEKQNKTATLFASGGIDSQCMIQAFIRTQRSFRVVFFKDTNDCNLDDYLSFKRFIDHHSIQADIIDFDFLQFVSSYKYLSMAFRYRFNNPEYGILLHFMDLIDGFYIYAGRPCSISRCLQDQVVLGLAVDETWSKARYFERNQKDGCPEFLSGTPDMVFSFLKQPIITKVQNEKCRWYYSHKIELLKSSGFDTSLAPATKFTGFEKMMPIMEKQRENIWILHRFPLKLFFRNTRQRATNLIHGKNSNFGFKLYPDGFSWDYLKKEDLKNFH